MHMIEISALENGAHRNQTYSGKLPSGWAVVPLDLVPLENFPFGKAEAEEINGVMTVTKWTPGEIPEVKEPEEPTKSETDETTPTVWDELDAAYQEGVDSV